MNVSSSIDYSTAVNQKNYLFHGLLSAENLVGFIGKNNTVMHGCGNSDSPIISKKSVNKDAIDTCEPLPNDDLDLQRVWLRALQQRGPRGIDSKALGEYWLNFIPPHWNEYGVCKSNLRAGLLPPLCGQYRNEEWKHSNGAWIRSEIWACLAPECWIYTTGLFCC